MDQLELENYIEKMKNRRAEGDYKTAVYIADKIDWENIQDVNLLVFASEVYDEIKDYHSAKAILEYAYSIAPVKNRLYYALCTINIKYGDFKKARDYYIDFCQSFKDDPRKNLLKYYFLKANGADIDQQIRVLEEYTEEEKEEDILYELAKLYDKLEQKTKVIEVCDFIVSFFGVKAKGFGREALKLKKKYIPLTDYEENLIYESELNAREDYILNNSNYNLSSEQKSGNIEGIKKQEDEEEVYDDDSKKPPIEKIQIARDNKTEEVISEEEKPVNMQEANAVKEPYVTYTPDKDSYYQNEKTEMAFLNNGQDDKQDKLKRMLDKMKNELTEQREITAFKKYREKKFDLKGRFNDMQIEDLKLHMIIEAYSGEEAISIASNELNYIHSVLKDNIKQAKVTSYNINEKGFNYFLEKLGNRDLIVEKAGRLKDEAMDDIEEFIVTKKGKNIIALVDVINNFDKIANERPSFIERFDIYSVLSDKPQENIDAKLNEDGDILINHNVNKEKTFTDTRAFTPEEEKQIVKETIREEKEKEKEEYNDKVRMGTNEDLLQKVMAIKKGTEPPSSNSQDKKQQERTMSIDEFVEYCKNYAAKIDCVIPGNVIPALYEKVEDMKEEGIPLTAQNATKFMENAADNAERPGLFKKPKYDKQDRLVINEEHLGMD